MAQAAAISPTPAALPGPSGVRALLAVAVTIVPAAPALQALQASW